MKEELKIKYRRYMAICTEVKIKNRELTQEEKEDIVNLRNELDQTHQEIIKTAGEILREDMV